MFRSLGNALAPATDMVVDQSGPSVLQRISELITTPVQMFVDYIVPPPPPLPPDEMSLVGRILYAPTGNNEEDLYLNDAMKNMSVQELLEGLAVSKTKREAWLYTRALGGNKIKLDIIGRHGSIRSIDVYPKMVNELYEWDSQGQPLPAPVWIRRLITKYSGIIVTPFWKWGHVDKLHMFVGYTHTDVDEPTGSYLHYYLIVRYKQNRDIELPVEILKYK